METEYFGRATRHLISCHSKGRAVPREELSRILGVSARDTETLVSGLPEFLFPLGLELVGVAKDEVVAVEKAKKFFLRKIPIETQKRVKVGPSAEEKQLFLAMAAVQLENNRLSETKFETIERSALLKGVSIAGMFNKYKTAGYLSTKREDERVIWSLGWRFYVEYGDSLDVIKYFNEISKIGE